MKTLLLATVLLFVLLVGCSPAYAQQHPPGAAVGVTEAASAGDQSGMDVQAIAGGKGILITGVHSVTASPDGEIHCYVTAVTMLDGNLATVTPDLITGNQGALTSVVRSGFIDTATPDTSGPMILARGLVVSGNVYVPAGSFFTCVASIVNREFKGTIAFTELR